MKEIIFITNGLFRTAGTERVIIQLYETLTENGFNVTIFVPGSIDCAIKNTKFINIKSANLNEFPEQGLIKKITHRIKYFKFIKAHSNKNICSFSFSLDLNILNILVKYIKKTNPIICEHIEYNYHSKIRKAIRILLYKTKNIKLVCLTDRDTEIFKNKKINAITIPNFTSSKNKLSLLNKKNILAIGRLEDQKNFSFLLDAFFHSNLHKSGWNLDIVGEGSEYIELMNKISQYNLTNSVRIHKFTNNIESFYINASIYCMSSKYEAFPMVLIEAISFGLPIISTDCPTGPSEIIKVYRDTQLSPINDITSYANKLTLIATDTNLRNKIAKANFEHSKEFTPNNVANKWINLIKSYY